MKSIQIYTTDAVKKQLRLLAAGADKTLSQYVEEILIKYLEELRPRPTPNDHKGEIV